MMSELHGELIYGSSDQCQNRYDFGMSIALQNLSRDRGWFQPELFQGYQL